MLSFALLVAAFALEVMADNLGFSADKPLKFGIDLDYAPMQYLDEDGNPQGYDIEFTELLMNRLDIPYTYCPNTWENIAGDVLSGKVDLGMMVYSTYRKNITNYSKAVFHLYYQMVYRKGKDRDLGLRNVKGKTIALMTSRPIIDTLTKAGAKVFVVQDLKKAVHQLSQGKYDAVICFRYQAKYLLDNGHLSNLASEDLTLAPREYCYVSHNKELIEAIDVELMKMEEEGIIEEIYSNVKTYLGGLVIPPWVWYLLAALTLVTLITIIIILLKSKARIKQERDRAQKSEKLKDIFLSNLSHALRTPLNGIIGFSEVMMDNENNISKEEKAKMFQLINTNGHQLLYMIEELLSLSNITGNTQLFNKKMTNVNHEVASYADEIRPSLAEGVVLEIEEPKGTVNVMVDASLMRLVVMHLLRNAQQHTKSGKIVLRYYLENKGLRIEVKDTGSGLPENLKENIFALLSDENMYLQKEAPGLGLSICKAVVDRLMGTISVRDNDEDGKGSIFSCWIPTEI